MRPAGWTWRLAATCAVGLLAIAERAAAGSLVQGGDKQNKASGKYQFVVELKQGSDTVCGGIAVGPNWVLTAAHCAASSADRVLAFGATAATLISGRYCHPEYHPAKAPPHLNSRHDLALLRTRSQLGTSWQRGNVAKPDASGLVVFGWGVTRGWMSWFRPVSALYKSKGMPLQNGVDNTGTRSCDRWWKQKGQLVDGEEFCAGAPVSSACTGDSGGPLFNSNTVGGELEPRMLAGILSKADDRCDASGVFDVYTEIDSAWVEKVVRSDAATLARSRCP